MTILLELISPLHVVPMPLVDLKVFVLPQSELAKVPSLPLFLKSYVGTKLELIRGVTLAMEIPATELGHVCKYTLL